MTPFVLACAGLGLFDHSRGAKSLHLKKEHVAEAHPLLTRTSESQLHIGKFFQSLQTFTKIIQNLKPYHWCDLSKRCLPNKSQARLQDGSHSSGYHGMWLVSNLSLKRGPIGWASYLFWAWCPRHIVLSNIQVLTASCSNLGDLPNFANAILKFVCSSLDQHIFAISWPCEGDHVWSCHIHVDSFRLRPPWRIHPLPAAGNACFNCLKCWQATRWTPSSSGGGEGLLGLHKSMAITVSQLTNFCYEFGWIWQGNQWHLIKRPWTEPTNTSETSIWSTTVLSLLTIPWWATFVGKNSTKITHQVS